MTEPAAIEFEDVTFSYPGARAQALTNVSLRVEAGERLGVLGPNGGGKSTLLKLALGIEDEFSGRVRVFGKTPREARRAGLIGYLPQRCEAELAFPLTGFQATLLGAEGRRFGFAPARRESIKCAQEAIKLVGAKAFADQRVGELSGGQLQRIFIARALAGSPRILALDEPTVGIDIVGQQEFAQLLERVHRELGVTILIVTHDVRAIAAGCDRVACLARTLHFHDSPQGLTPQVLAEVFQHDVSPMFGELHVDAHTAAGCAHDHGHDDRRRESLGDVDG